MDIDILKKLPYKELQQVYTTYLKSQNLSQNTIATSRNDAFYLLKNDSSIDFWALLSDANFEQISKAHLRTTLTRRSSGNIESNLSSYMSHLRRFRRFVFSDQPYVHVTPTPGVHPCNKTPDIPTPCKSELEFYVRQWEQTDSYHSQEDALNRLFLKYAPRNTDIADILLKVAVLNDFYSTNIFSVYPVAKHILSLNIDSRLQAGDISLINDIKRVEIAGKVKNFYSFATKYCSHHNPDNYPIYDSYVDDILIYLRNRDHFAMFSSSDLKDYKIFKEILIRLQAFYSLCEYSLKQLDQYLWQLGKAYFPKQYK